MKNTAFVLITLIVGSLASPTLPAIFGKAPISQVPNDARIVTGQIIEAIENLARQIREAGLDPYELDLAVNYKLPVPIIFSVNAVVENLIFTGLSNIVVERMNFSLLQNRLTFNIVLPSLGLSIDNAKANAILFGDEYSGAVSGSVYINTIRLTGDIRINIGIISGISIRSLSLQFSLGGIQSNLNINLLGKDLSSRVNTLLGDTIPTRFTTFASEINKLLEALVWDIINDALGKSMFSYTNSLTQ